MEVECGSRYTLIYQKVYYRISYIAQVLAKTSVTVAIRNGLDRGSSRFPIL